MSGLGISFSIIFLAFFCGAKMAATVPHAKKEKFLLHTSLSNFSVVPTKRCHWPEFGEIHTSKPTCDKGEWITMFGLD